MKTRQLNPETLIYALFFLLALGLRLFQLGAAPLTDSEAGWALQSLGVAHGGVIALGPQPAYILLTSLLFYIFGDTNFLARLLPALAGSVLVWLPLFFRRWMGESTWLRRAGLVMAFGLALDPGLVALSRQAGSSVTALAFTLLALACLYNRRMVWTGILAGLALLSGPAVLQGAFVMALSWGFIRLMNRRVDQASATENGLEPTPEPVSASSRLAGVTAFIATLLFAGLLFLRVPQGLGALAETLPAYLKTWTVPSGIPALRLPAAILVYQPLILIFGLIGAGRAWVGVREGQRNHQVMAGLSIWALVAVVMPLLYSGRQVGDLSWALVPLWALAAFELSRSFLADEDTNTRLVAVGLGLLLFVLSVVVWINLLSIGRYQVSMVMYWVIIIGALVLGFIAVFLSAAGWSMLAARLGVIWAVCVVLGLGMVSSAWGMAILRPNGAQELWSLPPATAQSRQLLVTLADLSSWNTGLRDQLEIVSMVDSPALNWALRNFPNTRFESALSATESPPVVITSKGTETPSLAEMYRGQDFVWRVYPGWQSVLPPNFINWLAFRLAPLGQEQIILWARVDIFPGGSSGTSEQGTP
jgi:hypothetical protein